MIVSNTAIDRSTTVFVFLALVVVMGSYAYVVLPREMSPEIVVPYIIVTTTYEGVTPEDMESLITVPIERKLTGISGIKQTRSVSAEGASTIVIEFEPDTVVEDALQKVRDKVDLAKSDLPSEADDPIVSEINLGEQPIMIMTLSGNLPLAALNAIAEDLEDRIETIKGVLDVEIIGGVEREIQIEVDPDRVAQYGISFADLVTIVQLENVNTPGGALDLGEAKFLMRTPGEFRSPEELEGLVVKQGHTGTVYLRDIATIKDGFKELDSISRVNGQSAVTLTVAKRSGENIISIADQVNAAVKDMMEKVPPGVAVATIWDESDWIRDMVSELENSILNGLILVLVVIFAFLGFLNAIFVALAIPISMLITFAVLQMFGVTLNMVVLFSLILALGMLVDNGIVVVENIFRHMQNGEERVLAAKSGTAEVAWPIISSTLTTIAAFVPMFFWPGIFGDFMMYLPLTVCVALTASLFVGLVVNPALAALFMPRPKAETEARKRHRVLHLYGAILDLALRWRAVTIVLSFTGLAVTAVVFFATSRTIFMPDVEPPQAYVSIKCPEGTNLETSNRFVSQAEEILAPHAKNLDAIVANVGSEGVDPGGSFGAGGAATHASQITLDFPKLPDCEVLPSAVLEELRGKFEGFTGAEIRFDKIEMGPPTGPPVNIEISGDDFEELARLAAAIRRHVMHVDGLVDLRDDYSKGKPEVRVLIDRQQAWRMGLNTHFIGLAVKAAIDGRKAGDFREGDEEYDVMVRFPKAFREDLSNIEGMNLVNLQGVAVPFRTVARLEQGTGLGLIRRIDRKRTVTVSAEVTGDHTANDVLKDVQARMAEFPLPPGYVVRYTGEEEDMQETSAFLLNAFVVAVFLIFLVLVTQFNSIGQPLIILSSVVLSLAGVFLGLMICRMPFGVLMTGVGCVSLAGVVVNNAIVLIDFINQLRASGFGLNEAIVEAGMTRFRPVMLTAVTTVLGLIPMALGISFDFRSLKWIVGGESSQWWGSMAVAVIFGLTFATLLTLVVVPTLYSCVESLSAWMRSGKETRAEGDPLTGSAGQ